MRLPRLVLAAMLLLALGVTLAPPRAAAAPAWGWTLLTSMAHERSQHTATPLGDGRILVAGGYASGSANSAEIYDLRTDRWEPTGQMSAQRAGHLSLRLADGRVAVFGGLDNVINAPFAERYDPTTSSWSPFGPNVDVPYGEAATLAPLPDGRVIGVTIHTDVRLPDPYTTQITNTMRVQLFDPASGTLTTVSAPPTTRRFAALTALSDGRVLLTGGELPNRSGYPLTTAEIYDPRTDRWSGAAPMGTPRRAYAATLLNDGRVLIAGGYNPLGAGEGRIASAEIYDPATDRWAATGALNVARSGTLLTLLPDGRVLATGGAGVGTPTNGITNPARAAEIYDPAQGHWSALPLMLAHRGGHTATALPDGQIVVIGGYGDDGGAQSAERYGPGSSSGTCFFQTGRCIAGQFLATWQASGGLALGGYPLTNERDERLEDGKVYRVQYFERTRIEAHPENAPPYDILLGQFGRRIVAGVPDAPTAPAAPREGDTFFAQTGHNVGPQFLTYWQAHGGLAQFGFPLTEEFEQRLENGQTYRVQYFERARFEHHLENAGTPYEVLLGQFGRQILADVDVGR